MPTRRDPAHPLRFETLSGHALRPLLPELGALIFAVFRDWPYLYASDPAAAQSYLACYGDGSCPGAAIVVAFDDDRPIGAATCQPMAHTSPSVPQAFAAHGLDPTRFCYLGEAVLLPAYRGRGAGVRFFADREAHARRLGLEFAAFCAVSRDPADPRKPAGYAPLNAFWRRRGYTPYPDLVCHLEWREIGTTQATPHNLSFWLKALSGTELPRSPCRP
jgi:GNAT superfamily N-acetyltransferase